MTTSGVINSTQTARDVVNDALVELAVYGANQVPPAADGALGLKRLNWMLKDWQNDGVNLWRAEDVTIVWPADTLEGDLAPNIQDIISLRLDTGSFERHLTRWELGDYHALPNKAALGTPSIFTVTRETANARLKLWPVSTVDVNLIAGVSRVIEDVTSLSETIDVPQQYLRTVMMCLAANLAPAFGKVGEAQFTLNEAQRLYRIMRANDRPASYFFESTGTR